MIIFIGVIKIKYCNQNGLLDLFKNLNLIFNNRSKKRIGIGVLLNKDGFIKNNNVHLDLLAAQFAENIKQGQNDRIIDHFLEKSIEINIEEIITKLLELDEPLLFSSRRGIRKLSEMFKINLYLNRDIKKWTMGKVERCPTL